jgi:serine/threonine-protein kinase ATR
VIDLEGDCLRQVLIILYKLMPSLRPMEKSDEPSRLELAARLAKLPCLLTLCSSDDCSKFRKSDAFSMVHLYLPAMEALLRGGNGEVTPAVRRGVFKALAPILRHRNEEDPGQHVMDFIFRGLADKDRGTRLQAGYVH